MKFTETDFKGSFLIELEPCEDHRGWFARTFCVEEFQAHGLKSNMVQSNLSVSYKKYTLRGMHYQVDGAEEVKLIRCARGEIWDVIIDIRPDSPTYCKHSGFKLSDKIPQMLYLPEGFAHGFLTLEDHCEVVYQVSNYYASEKEMGIRWNDPTFGIQWMVNDPIITEKDNNHPDFIP